MKSSIKIYFPDRLNVFDKKSLLAMSNLSHIFLLMLF